jgi:hypothetical protein
MPETILGDVASQNGLTWRLSLPTWGVDVDRLVSPLHWPMAHSCQARWHGLSAKRCLVLLLQYAVAPFGGCEASWA